MAGIGIFLLMIFMIFVVPVFCTRIIFQYGYGLAQVLVYLLIMMTVMYCMKEYGVHKWLGGWYQRKFGARLF